MRPVTIKDIALKIGVSKSTVSRALRDSPEIGIKTKNLILELARDLDFVPNPNALSLIKAQTQDIGVIVPDISIPFFALVIAGIEEVAFGHGFHVVIYQSHDDYQREVMSVKHVLNRRKDGLLVSLASNTKDYSHFKSIFDKGFPMVFFDRACPEIACPSVSVNDFEGAYMATEHLIKQGCKTIALVNGPGHLTISKQRFFGYQAALLQFGLKLDPSLIIETPFGSTQAFEVLSSVLKNGIKPDGLFAASDSIAIGCHAAIAQSGLSMPEDIKVIGFCDPQHAALMNPPLSTVSQSAFEMGQHAANMLIALIKNPEASRSGLQTILKTQIMVRASTNG